MYRRTFLTTTCLPFCYNALFANGPQLAKQNKSVIFIWLGGGISSTEFINPIPDSPVEFRSVNGHVYTKSGYLLGNSFQKMASISNKFTTVRSFGHSDPNHATATHWMLTGHANIQGGESGPQKEPSNGSIVSRVYGENSISGSPTYVKLQKIQHDAAATLGNRYNGFDADEAGINNLTLNGTIDKLNNRLSLLNSMEKDASSLSILRESATKIISNDVGKAFKLDLEPEDNRIKYNIAKSEFSKSLLLARRLVESGTLWVNIHTGGWDMHSDIGKAFPTPAADIDNGVYTLINDLDERGMLDSTLVVITTEFGRTYRINATAGRDHQANIVPLILAGGKYREGLIGTTDKNNSEVTSNKFSPIDLQYSILDHMGISKDMKAIDVIGRPKYFIANEARIIA